MKVLVISHMYPSNFNEVAGIFVHQQVKELQRQGCEIKVISPIRWTPFFTKHFLKRWEGYSDVPQKMIWEGIEVHYPRYIVFPKAVFFASSGKRMYVGIRELINKLYKDFRFDVIHAHVALPDGFAAMMVNRRYDRPLVVTIHGQDLNVTIYRSLKFKKVLSKVFKEADKVVTVSDKLKKIAKKEIGFAKKITVISNGVNPSKLVSMETAMADVYSNHKVILSVSHLKRTKGLDLNIRAVSKLVKKYPKLKYVVVGAGPDMSFLRQLTHDLNLDQQVDFVGQQSHDKVMEYMKIADVFSLPSWNEAFGVVYIEAMMHGKPVIACRGEGIDGVIENKLTGLLVKPKDVESLSRAIDFILENPQNAQELGERAKKLILENYTWEKNAQSYIKLYKELLEIRSAGYVQQ
ncbi:glycosyltransferase family 4 protein [Chloroflexota bacterium]